MSLTNKKMFLNVSGRVGLLVLGLVLSSCSMLEVKKDKMAGVRKVAVVAFSVDHQMPKGATLSLGSSGPEMALVKVPKPADYVDSMYLNLNKHLAKNMSWQMVEQAKVSSNERYRSVHTAQNSGFQNRPPMAEEIEPYVATGILDRWAFARLTPRDRDELMKHLGVDAIVAVHVNVGLEYGGGMKRLVGAIEYSPQATLIFQLFKNGEEAAIWKDYKAEGPVSDKYVQAVLGHANENKIFVESVVATNKAYETLSHRYEHGE